MAGLSSGEQAELRAALAIGHTLLGWNRFISSGMVTISLFAGASTGAMAVRAMFGTAGIPVSERPPALVQWLFLVLLMVGLAVVFQVSPRQAPWAITAGLLAYGGLEVGGRAGVWQGPFLGALALGCSPGCSFDSEPARARSSWSSQGS